jgi:hypothetical protein
MAMAKTKFNNFPAEEVNTMTELFEFIAHGKREGNIDYDKLARQLKNALKPNFGGPP